MSATKPFRVLISDDMSPRAAEVLAASPHVAVDDRGGIDAAELASIIGDYNGLIVRSRTKVTAALLSEARELRLVGRAGIGVDNIDLQAASRLGILVANAPSGNSVTTAEHALCLLLSLARHIPQATASMKAGRWDKNKFKGSEIMGKTLGVLGLGNIGRIVASRARGLHMKVAAYDPFISAEAAKQLGAELVELDELFSRADFITVHTPLTNQTRNLIDARALAKMKPGVLIVNAARGGIVDEHALAAALDSGAVGGVALDVYETEPPPGDHPLVGHPKVICTPHLGASTKEAQVKVAVEVADVLVAYAERGEVRNALNVARLSGDERMRLHPWLELCESLGALVGQLAHDPAKKTFIDELSVEVTGEPAEAGATACTNATLVGLLRCFLDVPVNEVNAPVIARDRGMTVSEIKRSADRDYTSTIAVTAKSGGKTHYVKGTLGHLGERVEPRIVQIDNFLVETPPRGTLLAVLNKDRPGVIGAVGTLLGKADINVNSLHVGLDADNGVAIALWAVDADVSAELMAAVRSHPLIERAQLIRL